jgi:hypothetical protein
LQIDKNACNKPLTLDCQVNSNPASNITWYRRRLSVEFLNQIQKLDKSSRDAVISSLSSRSSSSINLKAGKINMNDYKDIFYYEPIGIGPTYTIASFNCDNLLSNLKNRTAKLDRNQIRPRNTTADLYSRSERKNVTRRLLAREKPNKLETKEGAEKSSYSITENKSAVFLNSEQDDDTIDTESYDEYYHYDDEYEPSETNDNEDGDDNFIDSKGKQNMLNRHNGLQNNDFGVYMCEARNNIHSSSPTAESVYFSNKNNQNNQIQRRFIKLNPIGPPVSHPIPSLVNTYASITDDTVNYLMKNSLTDAYDAISQEPGTQLPLIDIPASLGTSVSLTCLIEPLPNIEQIIWLRENGKIIPSSKFLIESNVRHGSTEETTTNTKPARNIKIKNENLTLLHNIKYDFGDENSEEELPSQSEELNADLMATNGVRSINGNSINIMRSMLFIKTIRQEDFGVYKCKSINSYGSRTIMFLLREKTLMGI